MKLPTPGRVLKGTTKDGKQAQPEQKRMLVPELLDPRPDAKGVGWSVTDSKSITGDTDITGRRMRAPLNDDSPQAESVRIHELMHARITPENLMRVGHEKHGVTIDSLQACEDLRINIAAKRARLEPIWDTPVTEQQATEIIEKLAQAGKVIEEGPSLSREASSKLYHRAACVTVALAETQHQEAAFLKLGECVPPDVYHAATAAFHELRYYAPITSANRPSPNATIRAGKLLDRVLQRKLAPAPGENPRERKPGGDPRNTVKQEIPPWEDGPDTEVMIDALKQYTPELTQKVRKKARCYRRTADTGTLHRPTEAMRLDGTGLPFRRKLKTPMGAAILIDASGSMGFGHEQLAEIIKEVPGSLVMLHAQNGSSGRRGTFAVVGKGDYVIDEETLEELRNEQLGGGNANDPACVLLAGRLADKFKVKGPRFWVTDQGWGDMTGNIHRGNVRIVGKQCAKRAKFTIVHSIENIWA